MPFCFPWAILILYIISLRIPLSYFNVYSNKEHAMLIFLYVYFFILKAEKGILIYMM